MTSIAPILHEHRKDVIHVEFVDPCPDGWHPIPNRCHENANTWNRRFPSWTVIRGWLLIFEDDVSGTIFDAHSVVCDPEGRLWDVTQNDMHRFLPHPGDDGEFIKQVSAGPWVRVSCVP